MERGITGPAWRKSSYSSPNGNACVEVASWRKSSYSSGNGGECVETADAPRHVLVRDTTDRDGAVLIIPAVAWRTFTGTLK